MDKDENVERLLGYISKIIADQIGSKSLFEPLTEKEKLKCRIQLSNELRKIGIGIPPDEIQIIDINDKKQDNNEDQ